MSGFFSWRIGVAATGERLLFDMRLMNWPEKANRRLNEET